MTLEEAVEALYMFRGQLVDAKVALLGEVGGKQFLASFSGVTDEVHHWSTPAEHWTLRWTRNTGEPDAGSVTLWRKGFEGGEFEEPEGLTIRHRGVTVELFAYL